MEYTSRIIKLKDLSTVCTKPLRINPEYHRDCSFDLVQSEEYLNSIEKTHYAGSIIITEEGEVIDGMHRLMLLCFMIHMQLRKSQVPSYEWWPVLHKKDSSLTVEYADRDFHEIMNTTYIMDGNKFKEICHLCSKDTIELDSIRINIITSPQGYGEEIYKQENSFTEYARLTNGIITPETLKNLDTMTGNDTENYLKSYLKYNKLPNLQKSRIADIEVHARMYRNYRYGIWKDLYALHADYLLPVIYRQEEAYGAGLLTSEEYEENARLLSGYEVRRQIMKEARPNEEIESYTTAGRMDAWLQGIGYGTALDVEEELKEKPIYEDSRELTKFLLMKLEESRGTAAKDMSSLTIEHIMPQSIERYWGHQDKREHKRYVHTLGNLTLTANNSTMSNKEFKAKKKDLESYEINREVHEREYWNTAAIKSRTAAFTRELLKIYPLPEPEPDKPAVPEKGMAITDRKIIEEQSLEGMTGTYKKVKGLSYRGVQYSAGSWIECLRGLLILTGTENGSHIARLLEGMPKIITKDKGELRNPKELDEGYGIYYEANLSANRIIKEMQTIMRTLNLPMELVKIAVEYNPDIILSKDSRRLTGYEHQGKKHEAKDYGILERDLYRELAELDAWRFKEACAELTDFFYESRLKLKKPEQTELGMYYEGKLPKDKRHERISRVIREMGLEKEVRLLYEGE